MTKSASPPHSEQRSRPIDDGRLCAVALDQLGDVRLDPVPARLAPDNQLHLGGERLAKGERGRLALSPPASHLPPMPPIARTKTDNARQRQLRRMGAQNIARRGVN